jgi:hypothetical protein
MQRQCLSQRPAGPVLSWVVGWALAALAGGIRGARALGLAAVFAWAGTPGHAGEFWDNTYLLNLTLGSSLTEDVEKLSTGGYELADGTPVNFQYWYQRTWTDLHLQMLTQLSPDFGILWGLSAGESGPKYTIYPGVTFGVLWQIFQNGNSNLTLSLSTVRGGNLEELPCFADYGAIGGVQEVNCRLAASPIPPAQTLQYLVREISPDTGVVSLTYTIRF